MTVLQDDVGEASGTEWAAVGVSVGGRTLGSVPAARAVRAGACAHSSPETGEIFHAGAVRVAWRTGHQGLPRQSESAALFRGLCTRSGVGGTLIRSCRQLIKGEVGFAFFPKRLSK